MKTFIRFLFTILFFCGTQKGMEPKSSSTPTVVPPPPFALPLAFSSVAQLTSEKKQELQPPQEQPIQSNKEDSKKRTSRSKTKLKKLKDKCSDSVKRPTSKKPKKLEQTQGSIQFITDDYVNLLKLEQKKQHSQEPTPWEKLVVTLEPELKVPLPPKFTEFNEEEYKELDAKTEHYSKQKRQWLAKQAAMATSPVSPKCRKK